MSHVIHYYLDKGIDMVQIVYTPISDETIHLLTVGDMIKITGCIYTGRDAVLPKIVALIERDQIKDTKINLQGSVIFHTAVSPAGVGPTSSNKLEIESSIPILSKAGVKLHLGKGAISERTVRELQHYNSVYAVMPPVTALLKNQTNSTELVAFPELGMEAFYTLNVFEYPAIIAAAHGKSIYHG